MPRESNTFLSDFSNENFEKWVREFLGYWDTKILLPAPAQQPNSASCAAVEYLELKQSLLFGLGRLMG